MSSADIVTIVTSVLTLAGVIITVAVSNSKTLYRIDQLEKKVEKHNTVIERTYKIEREIAVIDEKISVVNHRIDDLEMKGA